MESKMKKLSPRNANTEKKLSSLRMDHKDFSKDFSILVGEDEVFLSQQARGEGPKQSFAMPKSVFNRIIDWYNRPMNRPMKIVKR